MKIPPEHTSDTLSNPPCYYNLPTPSFLIMPYSSLYSLDGTAFFF